jgi:hypothetical protein
VLTACGAGRNPGQGPDTPGADANDQPPPSDGAGDDAGSAPRCDPNKPFGKPSQVTELAGLAGDAWLAPDERTMLYTHLEPGNGLKIYVATRSQIDAPFGAGQRFGNVNGSDQTYDAAIAPDQLRLFYVSSGQELSISFRTAATDPFPRGGRMSLKGYQPSTDGGVRPRASTRGVYYRVFKAPNGPNDRLYFDAVGATTTTLLRMTDITFSYAVTAGEHAIYFSDRDSSHADGTGHFVTKRATRTDLNGPFGEPVPLPELVLDPDLDLRIDWVSEDECVLYGTVGTSNLTVYRAVKPM